MAQFMWRLIDDGTYCITKYIGNDECVKIPDHLNFTVVYDDIFKKHTELKQLIFPDTVTEIGGFVVDGCVNLKEVKLPAKLINFWQYAFTRCGIEQINIPGSVEHIVSFAFQQCYELKSVVINEGTTKLCAWAFKDCENLEEVYIPTSMKEISDKAFEGCPKVKFIYR